MCTLDCSTVVYHSFNCVDWLCTIFDIDLIHNNNPQPFQNELNKFNHVPHEHK